MARPSFQPTDEQRKTVWLMAAAGIPEEDIARCLGQKGISPVTLRKHFRKELDNAQTESNARMAGRLYAIANQNDDMRAAGAATMFWLKTRARWKEKHEVEVTGKDGGPVQVSGVLAVPGVVSPDEWAKMAGASSEIIDDEAVESGG